MKLFSNFLFVLFIIGVVLIFHEPLREEGTLYSHFLMTTIVVFGVGGLGLLIKKYFYYQYTDNIRVAFLSTRSPYIDNLLFKIIFISLIAIMDIFLFNSGLANKHTSWLLWSAAIAIIGVLLNVQPALLLTPKAFYYDDYIPIEWKWKNVQRIEFGTDTILIQSASKDFEMDLSLLEKQDGIIAMLLRTEMEQFGDTKQSFQEWLYSYAVAFNIPHNEPQFVLERKILT